MTFPEFAKQSWIRWIILIIICIIAVPHAFNRHVLVPIQDQLIEWYNINDIQYNLLMTLYAWPNFIFCVVCGILIDRFGVRIILILSWIVVMIGLGILVYSSVIKQYLLLCISRIIVGIGNESLSIACRIYVIEFFNRNEFALAFGVFVAFGGFGTGLNTLIGYQTYEAHGIVFAISLPLIIGSCVCLPLFGLMYYERYWFTESKELETKGLIETSHNDTNNQNRKFRLKDVVRLNRYYWVLLAGFTLWTASAGSFLNISVSYVHHMFGLSYDLSSTLGFIGSIMRYAN